MADILNSRLVLRLNSAWQKIGWATVAEAFTAMTGGSPDSPPALGLDIDYPRDENGMPNQEVMESANAVPWEIWKTLPIREGDMRVNSVKLKLRVPTVIVCPKFHEMPKKKLRPTKQGIRVRDKNICQYTGQVLTNKTSSLDHIQPRSKGGKDSWENLVLCHREVNSKKGNKFNHEAGLKLLRKPVAPMDIPICALITEVKHPDHTFF